MEEDKKHDDLTVFGKETANDRIAPRPLEERTGDAGPGEREERQQAQDQQIRDEQARAAGD